MLLSIVFGMLLILLSIVVVNVLMFVMKLIYGFSLLIVSLISMLLMVVSIVLSMNVNEIMWFVLMLSRFVIFMFFVYVWYVCFICECEMNSVSVIISMIVM